MKGVSEKTMAIVVGMLVITITGFVAINVVTGILGETFNDGKNNAESAGCDYQRNQFFNGNGDLGSLDERCVEEEEEQIQIDMVTAQENVELIRCMNSYVEENGNSNGITDVEC